jgi:hypothetical protein
MMGKAGATGIDGGVTGGCECALDPSSPKGTWSATWLSMFASVLIVRRRPHRRRR